MYHLLSVHFVKLIKDKFFWLMEGGIALWALFASIMARNNMAKDFDIYFYNVVIWIGVILAVYSVFFIGGEFLDGTLRNQIISGKRRPVIYLSHFVIILTAGILQTVTYFLISFLSGTFLLGFSVWKNVCLRIENPLLILLALLEYSAVFSCISIMIGEKTKILFVQVLLSVLLLLVGFATIDSLTEPRTIISQYAPPGGNYVTVYDYPNPRYPEGSRRTVYEWADAVNPSSFILHCIVTVRDDIIKKEGSVTTVIRGDHPLPFHAKIPAGAILLSACFLLAGCSAFQKKDLK